MDLRVTDVSVEGSYNETTTVLTVLVNDTHTVQYATNHGNDRLLFGGKRVDLYRPSAELGLDSKQVEQLSQFCFRKVEQLLDKVSNLVALQAKTLAFELND